MQIEQVEAALKEHLSVPFLITSAPDEKFGEIIVLLAEGQLPDDLEMCIRDRKPCIHWNVRMPCSPAKAGKVNSPLLFPKKRIKNNIPAHSGVSSLPYKRSGSRNWFCHVLPPDISEMIFHHSALLSGPATTIRA